ncbi:MAG: hydrogenase iron-sulfur subunit, partial [bacterium]|nr:hydrogenase iron-sulfur subunit [bacterium]
ARLLIEMGIRKIKSSADISTLEISPRQSVAVIGANAGSIAISQHLLDAGFKVYLVHKDSNIFLPRNQLSGMGPTLLQVTRHPRFKVFHKAQVKDFYGYTGDYTLHINADKNPHELHIGAVVLSLGEYPELIKMAHSLFHVDVDETGAIAALDEETARSRTREKGIFITNPLKHDHTDMSQMLVAADAAASMVINLLSRKEIYHQVKVSSVDEELCGGCGVCVKTCMFHAVTLKSEPKLSEIDPRRCMGCGNCVTACPAEARDLLVSPTGYLYDGVEILSEFTPVKNRPLILLITCDGCGYEAMDRAARAGLKWPVEVMPLPVVCGGQIDMQLIMHAFVKGFYGVVTLICGEGCCHNIIGNVDLERRVNLFKDIIVSRGIDADRLHIISTCNRQGDACVEEINRFYNRFIAEHRSSETITLR